MPTEVVDIAGRHKQTQSVAAGTIVIFQGVNPPTGWALCNGNSGTPDLRDRFVVGDSAVGIGTAGGTVSLTAALTHSGGAVGAHSTHVVTQPSVHTDHVVTQPANHSNHTIGQPGNHPNHAPNATHTHDAHTVGITTLGSRPKIAASSFTHAANATHTHDAHTAHSGASADAHSVHVNFSLTAHDTHTATALDAHSAHGVTDSAAHAVPKHYLIRYIMKVI